MPMLTVRDAYRWALEIETNGQAFYNAVATRCQDRNAKLLFTDLAEQEARHYRTFAGLLAKAPAAPASSPEEHRQAEAYLGALYEHALYGEGRGTALAQQATDESSAVRAAIAFEKDTLLFFHEVREQVAPQEHAALDAIIAEEKEHLRQLARVLRDLPWVS